MEYEFLTFAWIIKIQNWFPTIVLVINICSHSCKFSVILFTLKIYLTREFIRISQTPFNEVRVELLCWNGQNGTSHVYEGRKILIDFELLTSFSYRWSGIGGVKISYLMNLSQNFHTQFFRMCVDNDVR